VGFGHKQSGASPQVISGKILSPEKPRGAGVNPAALTRRGEPIKVKIQKS